MIVCILWTCIRRSSTMVKRRGTLEVKVPPLTKLLVRGGLQDVQLEHGLPAHDICWDLHAGKVTIRYVVAAWKVQRQTPHSPPPPSTA